MWHCVVDLYKDGLRFLPEAKVDPASRIASFALEINKGILKTSVLKSQALQLRHLVYAMIWWLFTQIVFFFLGPKEVPPDGVLIWQLA